MQSLAGVSAWGRLNWSEQLRDAHKVGLFQIFKSGERPVEILRQIKHLLGHFNDFFFLRSGHQHELLHNRVGYQGIPFELLADFECHVERTDSH